MKQCCLDYIANVEVGATQLQVLKTFVVFPSMMVICGFSLSQNFPAFVIYHRIWLGVTNSMCYIGLNLSLR